MSAVVTLKWNFSPSDYFETRIEDRRQNYTMTIADGEVQASIDSAIYEAAPNMREELHDALNDRFLAVQLLTHRPYELSGPTMTQRVHRDGSKDIFIKIQTAPVAASVGSVDFRVTDKDGNVKVDSKRDRIESANSLSALIAAHRADPLTAALLRSYNAAVRNQSNELVHLYEIRDALSAKFGGNTKAQTALGISASDWSVVGRLCNHEPLRQGRHCGRMSEALRDATDCELAEARRIARTMIEAYLRYPDASSK